MGTTANRSTASGSSSKPYPMRQPVQPVGNSSLSGHLQQAIDSANASAPGVANPGVAGPGAAVEPRSPHLQQAIDQSIASATLQGGQTK